MKPGGEENVYDVFSAAEAGQDEFLDDEVMCSLLGFNSNASNSQTGSADELGTDPNCFHSASPNEALDSSDIPVPLRSIVEFNSTGDFFSPASCAASPISNEDSAICAKRKSQPSTGGSEYVFGIGNPVVVVDTPGVYAPTKLEPLRSIYKPQFSISHGNNAASPANDDCAPQQTAAQPSGSQTTKDNAGLDHLLYTPVTEAMYSTAPGLRGANANVHPDFSALSGHFLRGHNDNSTPINIVNGQAPQNGRYCSANQAGSDQKASLGMFSPLQCQDGDLSRQLSFADNCISTRVIENETQENTLPANYVAGESDPSSAFSFMDMFRIDTIPIPQPADWKSPPLLPSGPHNTGNVSFHHNRKQTKKKAPPRSRTRKPTSTKRKHTGNKSNFKVQHTSCHDGKSVNPSHSGRHDAGGSSVHNDGKGGPEVVMPSVDGVHTIAVQPSRFCHICLRRAGRVTLLACGNALEGSCRKVVCEKCFETFGWNWEAALKPNSMWTCTHCRQACVFESFLSIYHTTL